jgi:hypothetical protein
MEVIMTNKNVENWVKTLEFTVKQALEKIKKEQNSDK